MFVCSVLSFVIFETIFAGSERHAVDESLFSDENFTKAELPSGG